MRRTSLAVALLLSLAGCAGPQAGDSCVDEASFACTSSTVALACEDGRLRAIPCSGPSGCVEDSWRTGCDMSLARAGDACPRRTEGFAICDGANPDQALTCTSGTWTAQACHACSGSGNPTCAP